MKTFLTIIFALVLATTALTACDGSGQSAAEPASSLPHSAKGHGFEWMGENQPIAGVEQRSVGEGDTGAVILWHAGDSPSPKVAVYLHHWGPYQPSAEAESISRLVEAGNTVVYPIYQGVDTAESRYLPNAASGVRAALAELDFEATQLVTIGYSTGGALAFDLAATAVRYELPRPAAAVAIFPGRNPRKAMPRPSYRGIAPETRLLAVDGPDSRIPESRDEAQRMLRLASRVPASYKRFLFWPSSRVMPQETPEAKLAQRWRSLLNHIDLARESASALDSSD